MSETLPASTAEKTEVPAVAGASGAWERVERLLAAGSEWLNPILVKEARQALKSRQFLVTFTLLLAFGWIWSLLGISLLSPGVYYAPGGTFMLVGYFFILAAPVLIVVPFSAFRSLAAEREDGTYELLSITTLNSRQIVTGKLGSAVLQMLVYYSALAPCLTFTYLLRGVDILTILFVLAGTFFISVLLSAAGLVMATVTSAKQWQALLSVVLLIGLLWATGVWLVMMTQVIATAGVVPFDSLVFWVVAVAVLSFYISFVVLFIQAAAAQLSFASDNRSTRIRLVMLSQQILWVGWMTYAWLQAAEDDILYFMAFVAGIYWFVCGSLLSGELAILSPRVKRSLPQSFLGRTALTWFNPGSGTGYIFATTNLAAVGVCISVIGLIGEAVGFQGARNSADWLLVTWLIVSYATAYLGVGRLLLLLLRRFSSFGMAVAVTIQIALAASGTIVPALLQARLQGYRLLSYSALQCTNWAWTLETAADGNLGAYPSVLPAVISAATLIFVINLMVATREVEQVRQPTPERVLADEADVA